ncbi:MAG: HAD-IB family phosphatase [Methanobacteriota archaeon]|nr:MAG: HAD-IB family phosphatase [Euryarchaeota archaeon]
MVKLVVFDMDGVLVDIESSWVHVHRHFGVNNEQSLESYLRGEIDDMEFIRRDVALWMDKDPALTVDDVKSILSTAPLMKGARRTTASLRSRGIRTAIISAGIDLLAERVAIDLGMDSFYANGFVIDGSGRLTGEGVLNVRLDQKGEKVRMIADLFGFDGEEVASIGNSRYDVPMFDAAGLGIAFCPEDDETRDSADKVVDERDLSRILDFIH